VRNKKTSHNFSSINLVFLSLYIFIAMFLLKLTNELNDTENEAHDYEQNIYQNRILKIDNDKLEYELDKKDIFNSLNTIKPYLIEILEQLKHDEIKQNIFKKYTIEYCTYSNGHYSGYWNILKILKIIHSSALDFKIKISNHSDCKYMKIISHRKL